jgi:hypothetical protein
VRIATPAAVEVHHVLEPERIEVRLSHLSREGDRDAHLLEVLVAVFAFVERFTNRTASRQVMSWLTNRCLRPLIGGTFRDGLASGPAPRPFRQCVRASDQHSSGWRLRAETEEFGERSASLLVGAAEIRERG